MPETWTSPDGKKYPIFSDITPADVTHPPEFGRGLVPRDYEQYPLEMFAPPHAIPIVPKSEWEARIREQEEKKTHLELLFAFSKMRHLDQNGFPYCWAFSVVHSVMLNRIVQNQPPTPLSATAVAATIKGGAMEGGWCGLAAEFVRKKGVPSQEFWPEDSASLRHGTPECWADAAKRQIVEDYVDLSRPVHAQNLTLDMVASCVFANIACPVDFNWWAHSVCAVRMVIVEAGRFGLMILNSWSGWGLHGMGILTDNKMFPDGSVATVVTEASAG